MSKSAGSTQSVSESALPAWQQPYVNQMMQEAQRLYGTGGPQFFPGSTVADFTPDEQAGRNTLLATSGDLYNQFQSQVLPSIGTALTAYDVQNNPVVAGAARAAINPIFESLTEEAFPAIRRGAVGTGNLGSTRQGIAEGVATGKATRQALDTTASLYNAAYGQGLNLLSNTLGQMPTLQQSALTPGLVQAGLGEQERALQQARINEDIARWTYNQSLPYQALAEYANYARGTYGGRGTSEVSAEGGSDWMSGLGLAMQTAPWWIRALGAVF